MEQRPAQVDLSAYADWEASASLSADGNETIREGRHPAPACLWGGGADAQVLNPNNAKESRYRASIPGYFMGLSAGTQGNPYKKRKEKPGQLAPVQELLHRRAGPAANACAGWAVVVTP